MPSNPAGSTGCAGSLNGSCFMPTMAIIGFCKGASGANPTLPQVNDTTGSAATTCTGLNDAAGSHRAMSLPRPSPSSLLTSRLRPTTRSPRGPEFRFRSRRPRTTRFRSASSQCPSGGLFNTGSATMASGPNNQGLPLFPLGGGSQIIGGPSQFVGGGGANFSMPTILSIFSGANCASGGFLKDLLFSLWHQ